MVQEQWTPPQDPHLPPGWARAAADLVPLDTLAADVVRRDVDAAFSDLADDDDFMERLGASVAENLRTLQDVLCGRTALTAVRLTEPFALAAAQARLRVPQTSLQRSYRVGFAVMWEAWSAQLVAAANDTGATRTEALDALLILTRTIQAYQDHVASQVAERYARADAALGRSRAHVRATLVRQLLREDATALTPSDHVTLDYPLAATHIAILMPDVGQGTAEKLLGTLQNVTHTSSSLLHPVDLRSTVVWLAKPCSWSADAIDGLRDRLVELGVKASLSNPGTDLPGLRDTWDQVMQAEGVRTGWGEHSPRVLQYADVALEAMLMRDRVLASGFMTRELGGLAADTEQGRRLRDTVEASFRLGSHVATAEELHLHEHSVRNRLQKAEELVGHSLGERRTELHVALRLRRLLDGTP
jgi:hypothetical protein